MSDLARRTVLFGLGAGFLSACVPPPASDAPTGTPANVIGSDVVNRGANVRSGPNTKSAVLTTLNQGTVVDIFGRSGNWVLVRIPGGRGWVHNSLLGRRRVTRKAARKPSKSRPSAAASPAPTEAKPGTVTVDPCAARGDCPAAGGGGGAVRPGG